MQPMNPSKRFSKYLLGFYLGCTFSAAVHAADASPSKAVTKSETKSAASLNTLAYGLLVNAGIESKAADAKANHVVSPVSLVSALGLVHAGTRGTGADELSGLIAPRSAREVAFQQDIPVWLKRIMAEAGVMTSVNRLWLEATLAKEVSPTYLKTVNSRYAAEAAMISFMDNDGRLALEAINQWVAQKTNDRIKNLLPAGAVDARTRAVLTNALHFKDAWALPFDPSATKPMPFKGMKQPVQTMRRAVKLGVSVQGGVTIFELDFQSHAFSLRLALNEEGQTDVAAKTLLGSTTESIAFERKACVLTLPKFTIDPESKPLRSWLESQNVKTVFSSEADFKPLLGERAESVALKDVYVSAGIEVEEAGVEAVAATAAVLAARSGGPKDACAVDRPFAFAIVHKPTGAPVFTGWVNKP